MTATSQIPKFAFDAKPIYPSQRQAKRDAATIIGSRRAHVDKNKKRVFRNKLRSGNAAKELGQLPGSGEALHLIMRGNFDSFDFVPAVLQVASPATISELNICTLGFNSTNAARLLDLLDAGQVQRCSFMASHFWRSNETDVYDALWKELDQRGHRAAALRSHAKILLFELSDGRFYTIEMSANLRSCRNIEQATIIEGKELLQFHRSWMMELLDEVYSHG